MVSRASLFFHHTQSLIGGVLASCSRLKPKPSLAEASNSTSSIASPSTHWARASLVRLAPLRAFTSSVTLWLTERVLGSIGDRLAANGLTVQRANRCQRN